MIIAVKRAVKGVHEKVINYLKHKNSKSGDAADLLPFGAMN